MRCIRGISWSVLGCFVISVLVLLSGCSSDPAGDTYRIAIEELQRADPEAAQELAAKLQINNVSAQASADSVAWLTHQSFISAQISFVLAALSGIWAYKTLSSFLPCVQFASLGLISISFSFLAQSWIQPYVGCSIILLTLTGVIWALWSEYKCGRLFGDGAKKL